MEVAQDVKFECTSDITVISHLDIPISVMPERPFLVSFMSLPKQFKTNERTMGEKKKNPCGVVTEGAPQGFPSTCPVKFNIPGQSSPEKKLGKHLPSSLPASQPTWNSNFPGETSTTCCGWEQLKCNILHEASPEKELSNSKKIPFCWTC